MDDPNLEKRTASGISVNLSFYLITGCLAILGAQAAILASVLDKREGLLWFGIVSGTSFVCLIAAIVVGGKGIYEITERGFKGEWEISTQNGLFNRQAVLTLLGVILLAWSTLLGTPKPDVPNSQILQLNREISEVRKQLAAAEDEIRHIESRSASQAPATRKSARQKSLP